MRIEFFDDDAEFGHLIYYDEDHNDPPAELLPATASWLKANLPETRIDGGDIGMSVVLEFKSEDAATEFRNAWGQPVPVMATPVAGARD